MSKSIEAEMDQDGNVHLKKPVRLKKKHRVIITILDDQSSDGQLPETAVLSEESLSRDWSRPEEDEAWSHLQTDQ